MSSSCELATSTVSASTQTGIINKKNVIDATAADGAAVAESTRAPRKPKLAAKHAAFVQFLFWLSKADSVPAHLRSLALSSDIESQRAFVDDFLSQQSELVKEMRAIVTVEAKVAKALAKAAAKAEAKAAAKATATTSDGAKAAASRGRKKKAPVAEPVPDIISELVSIANGGGAVDEVPAPSSDPVVAAAPATNEKPMKAKRAPRKKIPTASSDGLVDGLVIDGLVDGLVIDGLVDGLVVDVPATLAAPAVPSEKKKRAPRKKIPTATMAASSSDDVVDGLVSDSTATLDARLDLGLDANLEACLAPSSDIQHDVTHQLDEGGGVEGGIEGDNVSDDVEDVHVELIDINGKSFLRDDYGALYDPITHEPLSI